MTAATANQKGEPVMYRGDVRVNEPMSKHTSWRVGGCADRFFVPVDGDDLAEFLRGLPPQESITWVGLGSNLLVRDGGIRGVVVATQKGLSRVRVGDHNMLYAESGVSGAKIARLSVRHGLAGAEFFAGIPGTLGGALAMNAGAFGSETWAVVQSVKTIDRYGRVRRRERAEFKTGYRTVVPPAAEEWFIAANLRLEAGDVESGRERIKQLLARRAQTQPIQIPNAGSVFRNPPGDYAARLIEACGLKGVCEGDACISERHANFIVNRGAATAQQIETLIRRIQREVEDRQGIRLALEVRIVGEHV